MKIVIDIDEEDRTDICNPHFIREDLRFKIGGAIMKGTPLPEGHGRLIDADELKKVYDERITYLYKLNKKDNPSRESRICATNWCGNTIDELPTIIEAESEGV